MDVRRVNTEPRRPTLPACFGATLAVPTVIVVDPPGSGLAAQLEDPRLLLVEVKAANLAVAACDLLAPQAVVISVAPANDGFTLARRLGCARPQVKLVAVADRFDPHARVRAMDAGFHAFFSHFANGSTIVDAICLLIQV